jgi:hypothetical protein
MPRQASPAASFRSYRTLDRMGTVALIGWLLVAGSVVAGVYYFMLGVAALKHLPDATEQDRVVGWTLWWFLESARYDEAGKRLCKRGGAISALAWGLAIPGYYLALRR